MAKQRLSQKEREEQIWMNQQIARLRRMDEERLASQGQQKMVKRASPKKSPYKKGRNYPKPKMVSQMVPSKNTRSAVKKEIKHEVQSRIPRKTPKRTPRKTPRKSLEKTPETPPKYVSPSKKTSPRRSPRLKEKYPSYRNFPESRYNMQPSEYFRTVER